MRAAVTVVALALFACATTASRVQDEIEHQYDLLAAAFAERSLERVLSFRSPEFEAIAPNGERNDYAQMAEYSRIWLENNQPPIRVEFKIESLEMPASDRAVVRVLQRASRYQQIEGKLRKVEHEVRQRETWVRTPQGWKVVRVDEIDLANRKRWIDGELQQQPPRGQ